MNQLMDAYNLRARLSPALLTLLPVLFGLLAWVPNIKSLSEPVTGVAISAGVLFILISIARDAGKKAEFQLVQKWGGLPSVLMLRHNDIAIDRVTKERYHAKLQRAVENVQIPTPQQEIHDHAAADEQYRSCGNFLLRLTRDDKKFPLVKEENMNYGFRRNLYGLRYYGIASSLGGIALSGFKLYRDFNGVTVANPLTLFSLGACILAFVVWLFVVNENFVRLGAEAYALRLLEAIEDL